MAERRTGSVKEIVGLDAVLTPAYVYDLDQVRHAHALLATALPQPSRLFYSLKANRHPAIVRTLSRLGCAAEVCSPGELAAAQEAGVPLDLALYTGPGKRDADVAEAVKAGVGWFSVDSPVGLDQVDRIADAVGTAVRCLLRVNDWTPASGQALTMSGVPSQFGADAEWVEAEPYRFSSRPAASLDGFHLYMGSNLTSEEALVAQFARTVSTARRLTELLGLEPRMIDLGGGFGAPYARHGSLPRFPGMAAAVTDLLDGVFPGWRHGNPVVAFESGRYLSGTCGSLLTRVLDVKRSHGQPVVILESGINHLGGMSGLRRLPPLLPDLLDDDGTGTLHDAIVAGPLCTPLDTWARSADVPDVQVGDLVRVPNVGAYGLSASLIAFLGHPVPHEVVVEGGQVIDVSQVMLVRGSDARPNRPNGRE